MSDDKKLQEKKIELILLSDKYIPVTIGDTTDNYPNKLLEAVFKNKTLLLSSLTFSEDEITKDELRMVLFCNVQESQETSMNGQYIRMCKFIDKWIYFDNDTRNERDVIDEYFSRIIRNYVKTFIMSENCTTLAAYIKLNCFINVKTNVFRTRPKYQLNDEIELKCGYDEFLIYKNSKLWLTVERDSDVESVIKIIEAAMRILSPEASPNIPTLGTTEGGDTNYDFAFLEKFIPQEIIDAINDGKLLFKMSDKTFDWIVVMFYGH